MNCVSRVHNKCKIRALNDYNASIIVCFSRASAALGMREGGLGGAGGGPSWVSCLCVTRIARFDSTSPPGSPGPARPARARTGARRRVSGPGPRWRPTRTGGRRRMGPRRAVAGPGPCPALFKLPAAGGPRPGGRVGHGSRPAGLPVTWTGCQCRGPPARARSGPGPAGGGTRQAAGPGVTAWHLCT
jgi:hypothetical protein